MGTFIEQTASLRLWTAVCHTSDQEGNYVVCYLKKAPEWIRLKAAILRLPRSLKRGEGFDLSRVEGQRGTRAEARLDAFARPAYPAQSPSS